MERVFVQGLGEIFRKHIPNGLIASPKITSMRIQTNSGTHTERGGKTLRCNQRRSRAAEPLGGHILRFQAQKGSRKGKIPVTTPPPLCVQRTVWRPKGEPRAALGKRDVTREGFSGVTHTCQMHRLLLSKGPWRSHPRERKKRKGVRSGRTYFTGAWAKRAGQQQSG